MDIFQVDTILCNANIVTMSPEYPHARWIAIKDGKIVALSDVEDFEGLRGTRTEIIDCRGMTVLPGFHDAHCHPVGFIETLVGPDLSYPPVRSIRELQDKIRQAATTVPPGDWIRARGYNEFYLAEKRHPTRWELDEAASTNPVKLTHRSGHAYVLNSLGLKLANISMTTPEPPGGTIERDLATGEPNGLLYEMGSYLAEIVPPLSDDEMDLAMKLASEKFVSLGITSVQDASVRNDVQRWYMFQKWKRQKIFKPRVSMMVGSESALQFLGKQGTAGEIDTKQLQTGAVKIVVHKATGEMNPSKEELNDKVKLLHEKGFQLAIHAVDEDTIEAAYMALERAVSRFPRTDHRHRIEHCSLCEPVMAGRIACLGVMVVTQPSFIYYSGERYLNTIPPEQIKDLYPLATFSKSGIKMAAGSDCPVVPPDPLKGIYAAVTRLDEKGEAVAPEQRISVQQALSMYTDAAAYSCFQENMKGSLIRGKYADLVVVNDDLSRVAAEEIKNMEVRMTMIGGEIAWNRGF